MFKFFLKLLGIEDVETKYISKLNNTMPKFNNTKSLNCEFVDLDKIKLDVDIVKFIPDNLAKRYNVVPIEIVDRRIKLAMVDPTDVLSIDDIRLVTGYDIEPVEADESAIKRVINRVFDNIIEDNSDCEFGDIDIEEMNEEPVARVFRIIIDVAIQENVSEIRIISEKDKFVVYYVENGNMREVMQPPNQIKKEMLTYIKMISNLDVLRNNIQQDGKITYKYEGIKHDLTISIVPSQNDENVFMKILN